MSLGYAAKHAATNRSDIYINHRIHEHMSNQTRGNNTREYAETFAIVKEMYDIKTEEPIVTNKIRVAIQTKKTVFQM